MSVLVELNIEYNRFFSRAVLALAREDYVSARGYLERAAKALNEIAVSKHDSSSMIFRLNSSHTSGSCSLFSLRKSSGVSIWVNNLYELSGSISLVNDKCYAKIVLLCVLCLFLSLNFRE